MCLKSVLIIVLKLPNLAAKLLGNQNASSQKPFVLKDLHSTPIININVIIENIVDKKAIIHQHTFENSFILNGMVKISLPTPLHLILLSVH